MHPPHPCTARTLFLAARQQQGKGRLFAALLYYLTAIIGLFMLMVHRLVMACHGISWHT